MNIIVKSSNGIALVPIETKLLTGRKIFIEGAIDSESADTVAKQLMLLRDEDREKPIDILINSTGGEVNSGLMLYDLFQSADMPIRMVCLGKAYSMAAVIFASGNERVMLQNSKLMLHEPLIQDGIGGNTTTVRSISDSLVETRDRLNSILAKHTNHSVEEIEQATNYDHYFSADESIEFGLCDKIVGLADIMR